MIIFQDYYNMDDCFTLLTENTIFIGGDIRDKRNWVVRPEFSTKLWFLSHQLVDNSYEDTLFTKDIEIVNEEYMKRNSDSSDSEEETTVIHQHLPKINTNDNPHMNTDSSCIQNVYFREI
jgi:hypothetical protein